MNERKVIEVAVTFDAASRRKDKCWTWPGSINNQGYGTVYVNGKHRKAHRVMFEAVKGQIPEGLDIDHLCRNRACVNPFHLDAVTHWENVMRGKGVAAFNRLKTHCRHGHEYTVANTYIYKNGRRDCRRCRAASSRKSKARHR